MKDLEGVLQMTESVEDPYSISTPLKSQFMACSPALLPVSPHKEVHDLNLTNGTHPIHISPPSPANGVPGQYDEVLSIDSVRKRTEVLHTFPCFEVASDGKLIPRFVFSTGFL